MSRVDLSVEAAGGDDAELRADVRRIGTLLGESLVRQVGPELLDLVERIRSAIKDGIGAGAGDAAGSGAERAQRQARELLAGLPLDVTIDLVRAFSSYFQLANIAEQVHRVRGLRGRSDDEGWLSSVVAAVVEDAGAEGLAAAYGDLAVRPVFTAHPTEASRRSVLSKLRAVAGVLGTATVEGSAPRRRQDRVLAELIDLI